MSASNFLVEAANRRRRAIGPLAYGAFFVVVLPILLAAWAVTLDRRIVLPVIGVPAGGVVIALAGALLLVAAVVTLRVRGGGWPMSPYPPTRFVTSGVYALVGHPLYLGSILVTLGLSIAFGSAGGVWIVTPVLTAACIVFVWGFERERTEELFGSQNPPLIHKARGTETAPTRSARGSFYFLVLLPWFLVYEAINRLELPPDAVSVVMHWDSLIPVIGWTELIYFSTYPLVLLVPFAARSGRDLRDLTVRAWIATASSAICYLVVPTVFQNKPFPQTRFAPMLEWERAFDASNTAFPAFHVIWAMLALDTYVRAFPRLEPWRWPIVLLTAASCLTTGMHAVADVIFGLMLGAACLHVDRVWGVVLRGAEKLSESRAEWRFGPLRLINHGIYACVAVVIGVAMAIALAGERHRGSVVLVAGAIIIGAALWAQLVEGTPALSRPFGYYGGVLGAMFAIAIVSFSSQSGWLLLAAYGAAAPLIQATGRLRCIVQGCCHGRPSASCGVRVWHPQSRVVSIAGLGGVPLHPTAVYSIAMNLCFAVLLWRMWIAHAPLTFIAGAYLILSGLGRFIEEHYRGEPQTKVIAGLRLYQWMSIGSLIAGAILTTIPSSAAPEPASLSGMSLAAASLSGLFAFIAYGMDFPASHRRFARLS